MDNPIITNTKYDNNTEFTKLGIIDISPESNTYVLGYSDYYYYSLIVFNSKEYAQNSSTITQLSSIAFTYAFDCSTAIEDHPYVLMDFIPGITLKSILLHCKEKDQLLKPYYLYTIILGMAKGLADLHQSGRSHREFYPAKILIDPDFHPHLGNPADSSDRAFTYRTHGSERFLPPEAAVDTKISISSAYDVFTFGGTLFQMITLLEPFEGTTYNDPLREATANGKYDERIDTIANDPSNLNQPLAKLVKMCWAFNPEDRPQMSEIVNWVLQGAQSYLNDEEYQQLLNYYALIQPGYVPPEFIQGTSDQINKAYDNGFVGISIDDLDKNIRFIAKTIWGETSLNSDTDKFSELFFMSTN